MLHFMVFTFLPLVMDSMSLSSDPVPAPFSTKSSDNLHLHPTQKSIEIYHSNAVDTDHMHWSSKNNPISNCVTVPLTGACYEPLDEPPPDLTWKAMPNRSFTEEDIKIYVPDVTDSRAVLKNNGFVNVVVAFADDVDEQTGWKAVQNAQELLTQASSRLFVATRKRAYFRDIHFLVPSHWSNPPSNLILREQIQLAVFQEFGRADFQVSNSSMRQPHTKTLFYVPDACGRPQGHVHLPFDSLLQYRNKDSFGKLVDARRVVQQWAKHRWGVFEEYVEEDALRHELKRNPGAPKLQPIRNVRNKDYYPNVCVWPQEDDLLQRLSEAGEFRNVETNTTCNPKKEEKKCLFYLPHPGSEPAEIHASIMSMPTLKNADVFCNSSQHGENKDGWNSPGHLHSRLCYMGESTWRVITTKSSLDELYHENNPPRNEHIDTTPSFRIVRRPSEPRIVLVLDTSQSNVGKTFASIYTSVKRFLHFDAEDSWLMGIVSFSDIAHVRTPLVPVKTNRHLLLDSIPLQATGKTCLSCGISKALEVMSQVGSNGGHLILVTDGLENMGRPLSDMISSLEHSGALVSVLAINQNPPHILREAFLRTHGRFYTIPSSGSIGDFGRALFDATNSIGDTRFPYKVKILSEEIPPTWSHFKGKFPVDSSVARDLVIVFSCSLPTSILGMTITDPKGNEFQLTKDKIVVDKRRTHIHFRFPQPDTGFWKYEVILTSELDSTFLPSILEVTSRPIDPKRYPPLLLTTRIVSDYDRQFGLKRRVTIVAELTQGNVPVSDACVIATIHKPNGTTTALELYDNTFQHVELVSDGVYYATLEKLDVLGWYSVTVAASWRSDSQMSRRRLHLAFKQHNVTGPFQRVSLAGTFSQPLNPPIPDEIAPPPIEDLKDISPLFNYNEITLQWRAPGDSQNEGMEWLYEFRYSAFRELLEKNFTAVHELNSSHIIQGSLEPKPAGTMEQITFHLPEGQYYIAGRVINHAGNASTISAVVCVHSISVCLSLTHPLYQELYPNPQNCSSYLQCEFPGYKPAVRQCPENLLYNTEVEQCDWPKNVNCDTYNLARLQYAKKGQRKLFFEEDKTCSYYRPELVS